MAQFVVRAQGDPAGLATAAREALLAADTNNVPGTVATMEEEVDRSVSGERVRAAMAGSFALLALLLACIGIYGLLADDVAARTREIGLRMALGAGPGDVLRGVARRGLSLTAAGLVLGLGGAWAVAGLIRSMLYGATPLDSAVLIVGALLTLCAAALACYLPARRAMSVDPVTALRNE